MATNKEGNCKSCSRFFFRLKWGHSDDGYCEKCADRKHQVLMANLSQKQDAAKHQHELKKTEAEKVTLEVKKQVNKIQFDNDEATRKHEKELADKKSRNEAASRKYEMEKIVKEADKLKIQLQIVQKQHEENEANRTHQREEAEKKHQRDMEMIVLKEKQAERQERCEERQAAERQRQHEMRIIENKRMLAAEEHARKVEIEKLQLEKAKHELERIERIDELLSRSDHQQVSMIRDILIPEQRHNSRITHGHQVERQILNYDIM